MFHDAYESRRNYAHVELEALNIAFGAKRLHQYLAMWLHVYVDHSHQPLSKIFGDKKVYQPALQPGWVNLHILVIWITFSLGHMGQPD